MELAITPVPLGNLSLSPKNARKVDPGPQAHAEMVALISAAGLIYPLCVEPARKKNHYEVVEGGRRFRALETLAANGDIAPDFDVPCRIVPEGTDAEELSIMGNAHEPMHTADQVRAFAKLAADGMAIPTIAERFGVSDRTVERRLRLANIAPAVLDAYAAGEMNLETLEAFAVTADQDHQAKAWEALKSQPRYYGNPAHTIRRVLTEDRMKATHPLARYATKRAYLKAGGRITEDLFPEDKDSEIWYDDPEIVRQVASARLEKAAEKAGAGWAWVEAHLESPDYSYLQRFGTVTPQATPEESQRLDEIAERIEAIYDSDDELTENNEAELRSLREEHTTLHESIRNRPISDEAKKRAGIIVTLDHSGRVTEHAGLLRPEDIPDEPDPDNPDAVEGPRVTNPVREPKFYSDSHADVLRAVRGTEVQAKLAVNFETAFDLHTFQIARQILTEHSYLYGPKALAVSAERVHIEHELRNEPPAIEATAKQREALANTRAALNLGWTEHKDEGLSYRAFCDLRSDEKLAIFAYCVANTTRFQLSFDAACSKPLEVAIEQIQTEPDTSFRPGGELFWKRLRKGQILDIAEDIIGPAWTDQRRKTKKGDLVPLMERIFANPASDPDVPAQAHERIRAWTIPGFPAHGPDPLANSAEDPGTKADAPTGDDPDTPASSPDETLPEFLDG